MTPDEMKHFREVGDTERNAMRMVAFAEIERRRVEDHNNMLKAENKKLRELVCDIWDVALHPETFGDGGHLLRRIRDLGIEVD